MASATTEKDSDDVARGFINGVRTGTPIAIGYIPSAAACGILADSAGLLPVEALFMSLIVFAGASQFVALNLIMIGATFPEIVLATAILNARHIMFASSITRRLLPGVSVLKKAWIGFEITDESFSVASAQKQRFFSPEFLVGLNLVGHCVWVCGTLVGFFSASVLPPDVQNSIGIAIYALFIGLLVPMVRHNRPGLVVTAAAMALSAFLKWTPLFSALNTGLMIMFAATLSALLGASLLHMRRKTL